MILIVDLQYSDVQPGNAASIKEAAAVALGGIAGVAAESNTLTCGSRKTLLALPLRATDFP